jgi:hypothetical protein
MSQRVPIKYRGFWDVPRIFLAYYEGQTFLFDCAFDEELDDYPETYKVFLMPNLRDDELPTDWTTLPQRALRYLGDLPVSQVSFDPTRRQTIDSQPLDALLSAAAPDASQKHR